MIKKYIFLLLIIPMLFISTSANAGHVDSKVSIKITGESENVLNSNKEMTGNKKMTEKARSPSTKKLPKTNEKGGEFITALGIFLIGSLLIIIKKRMIKNEKSFF